MIRFEILLPAVAVILTFALSSTWAEGDGKLKPRVVKTRYLTEDVVIATAVATDFGVKGDGVTDDTAALQEAVDAVAAVGGGVVFLPESRYRLDGQLVLKETVTLRGDWCSPEKGVKGTLLLITGGRGEADGKPAIVIERGAGLREVSLWWPEQKPGEMVPYPWAIKTSEAVAGDNYTIRNVTLVNAYRGIKIGPEFNELHLVRNVFMTVLKTGIFMDTTTDIGRLMGVRISPKIWETSGLPNAPKSESDRKLVQSYMLQNATGIEMRRSDWEYFFNLFVEGCNIGMHTLAGVQGTANGVVFGSIFRDCRVGFLLEELNPVGLAVTGSRIDAIESAVKSPKSFGSIAQFNTCTFGGKPKLIANHQGGGKLSFQNCVFESWDKAAIHALRGSVNLFGCDFRQEGVHVDLAKDVRRAHLLGNRFEGNPRILSTSKGEVVTDHSDFNFAKPDVRPVALPKDRRPKTDYLFNVADYGALADAKTDNTAAFQKALDDAGKAGGGTVYVPGGNYRFEGRLRVPSGVELRGIHDVPHHPVSGGSVLMPVGDRGKADAPPFISLAEGSGVRGITVWHPEQNSKDVAAYPWVVQSQGPGCWVVDLALANSYQGVDFGSYPSDKHLIRYLCGAPLKTGLRVSRCNSDGWVENIQFNPHYWLRKHPSYPQPDESGDSFSRVIGYQNANLDGLVFGGCRNEQIAGSFIFAALRGLYFTDDGGAANARVIQHGTDGATVDVVFDAVGPKGVELINAEFVPLFNTAKWAIETTERFTGKVSVFNTLIWGIADSGRLAGSGQVLIQQVNSMVGPFHALGGKIRMENLHFQSAPEFHIRTSPALKELLLIGNTGKSGFKVQPQPGEKIKSVVESQL